MSERKAAGTTAMASGAMDAKGGGNKVVERSRLAAKGDAVERVKDKDRNAAGGAGKNPKKRRKVNHVIVMFPGELDKEGQLDATVGLLPLSLPHPQFGRIHVAGDLGGAKVEHVSCVYCRRSHMTCDLERPCTRCIKRNIGHLCHDEPRESEPKKKTASAKTASTASVDDSDTMSPSDLGHSSLSSAMGPPPAFDGARQRANSGIGAGGVLGQGNPLSLVQPDASSGLQSSALNSNGNANQFAGFSDAWLTAQNYHDMNTYNPNYMIGPEVTHEFNLLNDFLHSSLLDESNLASNEAQNSAAFNRPGAASEMLGGFSSNNNDLAASGSLQAQHMRGSMLPPPNVDDKTVTRSNKDKTREYYLQAADPSGNDNPEERMSRVLKAKYDAGLLKPFNYINGYAKLGKYLDGHIAPSSKQKILRTINQFRPKFREKAQGLTDMQLVYVEMWFEKQLMDYDRVFASMAVPACCWRRTGEIFRGNKEMAELINVPVDQLRDGKIALHEILTEESMVRYWEEFGTIAFDPAHDTLLTACSLKNPSDSSDHPIIKCCFSFSIRRDEHKLPALIVGNFLPHDPPAS